MKYSPTFSLIYSPILGQLFNSTLTENIRKTSVFLMFFGGKESKHQLEIGKQICVFEQVSLNKTLSDVFRN